MPDIFSFKDDLLVHLNEHDKANPEQFTDITDFIKSYGLSKMYLIAPVINELYAPEDRSAGLITSSHKSLGKYDFTQSYFNTHITVPIMVRITSVGKRYLADKTRAETPTSTTVYDNRTYTNTNGIQVVDSPQAETKSENSFSKVESTKKKTWWERLDIMARMTIAAIGICGAALTFFGIKSCSINNTSRAQQSLPIDSMKSKTE